MKYGLPGALKLLIDTPDKETWREKEQISAHWEEVCLQETVKMLSLQFASSESLNTCITSVALVWTGASTSRRETEKGHVKARLLCGALLLNSHEATINRGTGLCSLCQATVETREHFLLQISGDQREV